MPPIRISKPSNSGRAQWRRSPTIASATKTAAQTTHNKTPVPWPVDLGSPEANRSMAILGTLSCTAQVDSQVLSFITRLWPRRLAIVDEQKGLVFAFPMFQHHGGVRTIKILGVPGVDRSPWVAARRTCKRARFSKSAAAEFTKSRPWGRRFRMAR